MSIDCSCVQVAASFSVTNNIFAANCQKVTDPAGGDQDSWCYVNNDLNVCPDANANNWRQGKDGNNWKKCAKEGDTKAIEPAPQPVAFVPTPAPAASTSTDT